MDRARASALAERFPGLSLLVVGDLMIDQYLWGSVSRISPEAPVPVVRLEREDFRLGGAGNVVNNLVALGARAIPAGVLGDDRHGGLLQAHCRDAGIPADALVIASGRPTTVKTRVIAHNQQVVRVDREVESPLDPVVAGRLKDKALAALAGAHGLVISDYDKGAISADLLGAILPEAARLGLPIVVDPKVRLFPHYRPATVVTPNTREAMEAAGFPARTEEEFDLLGRKLLDILDSPCVLITRGERGMLLARREGGSLRIAATAREVFDVTGAGDTVAATLLLSLASGSSVEEAALLANRAAGVVVGRIGAATLTIPDLLATFAG